MQSKGVQVTTQLTQGWKKTSGKCFYCLKPLNNLKVFHKLASVKVLLIRTLHDWQPFWERAVVNENTKDIRFRCNLPWIRQFLSTPNLPTASYVLKNLKLSLHVCAMQLKAWLLWRMRKGGNWIMFRLSDCADLRLVPAKDNRNRTKV